MNTLERLDQANEMSLHLAGLKHINLATDTRSAVWIAADGSRHSFDAPARYCYSAWDGYWSNFRLADYVGVMFPAAVLCGFNYAEGRELLI